MSSINKHLIVALAFAALGMSGCKRMECGEYDNYLYDPNSRGELIEWADKEIFSKSFPSENFARGGMDGPGPSPGNLKNEISSALLSPEIGDYNIRFLGRDASNPDMILIGKRKYQGILISRGDFDADIAKTRLTKQRLEGAVERVGLLCLISFD